MAYISMMYLYQEKFADIQEFRDQYMAVRKVCDEPDLNSE